MKRNNDDQRGPFASVEELVRMAQVGQASRLYLCNSFFAHSLSKGSPRLGAHMRPPIDTSSTVDKFYFVCHWRTSCPAYVQLREATHKKDCRAKRAWARYVGPPRQHCYKPEAVFQQKSDPLFPEDTATLATAEAVRLMASLQFAWGYKSMVLLTQI